MDNDRLEREVDANLEAFEASLKGFLENHRGQFALMRDRNPEGFFDSAGVALAEGRRRFSDGLYSIQEVTDRPVDLGFFSHAVNPRLA